MAKFFNHKFLLNCCNFLFLVCGIVLIISGFYILSDTKRVLLSRLLAATSEQLNSLPQPLFYYISLGLAVAGTIAVLAAIIGFWASCLNTYCFLSLYFLTVILLLLAESVVCLAITLWPHCLGLNMDETKMVKALQGKYGIPGNEQFTIAVDLAQTRFGCCGMNSDINYDTSLWRLQGYGQRDWTVPLTCCILENASDKTAYLDPMPTNDTQCLTLQKVDFEKYRHTEPCLAYLDNWYREQYAVFLAASLVLAVVEFCVLLSIVLNCTKISGKFGQIGDIIEVRSRGKSKQTLVENIYEPEIELRTPAAANTSRQLNGVPIAEFKEMYVQPRDLYKNRHNTTFKPSQNHYQISTKSYLV